MAETVRKDTKTVQDFAYGVIKKRRQEIAEGTVRNHNDLMQLFMNARDENDIPLSDEMLKDELINMILGKCCLLFYVCHHLVRRSKRLPGYSKNDMRISILVFSWTRYNCSGTLVDVLRYASLECLTGDPLPAHRGDRQYIGGKTAHIREYQATKVRRGMLLGDPPTLPKCPSELEAVC